MAAKVITPVKAAGGKFIASPSTSLVEAILTVPPSRPEKVRVIMPFWVTPCSLSLPSNVKAAGAVLADVAFAVTCFAYARAVAAVSTIAAAAPSVEWPPTPP